MRKWAEDETALFMCVVQRITSIFHGVLVV